MTLYIAAPLPDDLAAEMEELVQAIRASDDARVHRAAGIELILRLTDAGLDAFFLRPVEIMGLGMIAKKTTQVGLRAASRAIGVFVKQIGRGFDDAQIRALAELLDDMVLVVPDDEDAEDG